MLICFFCFLFLFVYMTSLVLFNVVSTHSVWRSRQDQHVHISTIYQPVIFKCYPFLSVKPFEAAFVA